MCLFRITRVNTNGSRDNRDKFANQWVALSGEKLVASGADAQVLAKKVRKRLKRIAFSLLLNPATNHLLSVEVSGKNMSFQIDFEKKLTYESIRTGITIDAVLRYGESEVICPAKVDTGSEFCLFARTFADALDCTG